MLPIRSTILFFVSLWFVNPAVYAVPLAFTETTDFGTTNTSTTFLGSFDIGVNTVSGSILAGGGSARVGSDYGDFWDATLLAGQQITSIEIVLSDMSGVMRAFAGDNIVGGYGPFTSQAFTQQLSSGTYALETTDPFGGLFTSGSYPFAAGDYYFGVVVPGTNAASFNYEWSITVTEATTGSVPEPASIALMGFGLAGLGFARRRKQD